MLAAVPKITVNDRSSRNNPREKATKMKRIIFIPVIFFLSMWIQSCGPMQEATTVQNTAPVERVIEKERIINKPFDEVWQNIIELLAVYNMPIKNLDKNSGFIATEYKLITGVGAQ